MPLRQALPLPRALIPHVQDFAEVTFPHLAPVCAAAKGEALLLLTRHADVFAERLPRDPATRVLLPLLARAAGERLSLCMLLCVVHISTPCPWNDAMQASALQPQIDGKSLFIRQVLPCRVCVLAALVYCIQPVLTEVGGLQGSPGARRRC